jgi:acyl-CoA thioesterase FadM
LNGPIATKRESFFTPITFTGSTVASSVSSEAVVSARILRERFGAVTAVLRAEAEFIAPARYDDVLAIVAHVEQWEARRFRVTYTLSHEDRPVAKGYETRAWATVTPDGRLKGAAIAAEFRALLES